MTVDEIVCREFVELATDYLDGAMPEETLELVEEHLAMCDWCRDYLHQVEATTEAVARAAGPDADAPGAAPPDELLTTLVGAFRRREGDAGP